METLRLKVDPEQLTSAEAQATIEIAAALIRAGRLVAFPTETVYGLGANALDAGAVESIFSAKQRPAWDPVIVHIAGATPGNPMLSALVTELPRAARLLMEAFWPGPLTLLLPRSASVPEVVTAGRPLVGVRMPAHPVAYALLQRAGVPIAAPSANLFGRTSPTLAAHVLEDLDGRIDAVLDAGPTQHGLESTVVDPCQDPVIIYRPGAITLQQVRAIIGRAEVFQSSDALSDEPQSAMPSPGVGIRHYAPRAKLMLLDVGAPGWEARMRQVAAELGDARVGILLPDEYPAAAPANALIFRWGRWSAPEELAQRLYAALRWFDAEGCAVILCPLPGGEGLGAALRDRLQKAAWKNH